MNGRVSHSGKIMRRADLSEKNVDFCFGHAKF